MSSGAPPSERHWPFDAETDGTDDHDAPDSTPPPDGAPPAAGTTRRRVSKLTILGLALLVAGLSLLGYVGYQYLGSNVVSERQYDIERDHLRSEWANPQPPGQAPEGQPPAALPGNAMALMRIPAFGEDYEVPLIQGTDTASLAKGIGVYDQSPPVGSIGNFAVAGHRVTHGEPFRRILELEPGDTVIVETRTQIFTYVLDTSPADLTVDEHENWVIDPVPGKPDEPPTTATITLTTCTDLFRSPRRSVGFGHLSEVVDK